MAKSLETPTSWLFDDKKEAQESPHRRESFALHLGGPT